MSIEGRGYEELFEVEWIEGYGWREKEERERRERKKIFTAFERDRR
jgi:hypothetical protein